MTLQAQLNESYYKTINLDDLLDLAVDEFAANQIRCYALRVASEESDSVKRLEMVKEKAISAKWVLSE